MDKTFSLSFQIKDPKGGIVNVTLSDGATIEEVRRAFEVKRQFLALAEGQGWRMIHSKLDVATPEPAPVPAPSTQATPLSQPPYPASRPAANGSAAPAGALTFAADTLSVKVEEGKTFFKVKGGKFSKFGVTVWPEVLEAAGIDPQHIPVAGLSLKGWTAHYTETDGRQKVVHLEKF